MILFGTKYTTTASQWQNLHDDTPSNNWCFWTLEGVMISDAFRCLWEIVVINLRYANNT